MFAAFSASLVAMRAYPPGASRHVQGSPFRKFPWRIRFVICACGRRAVDGLSRHHPGQGLRLDVQGFEDLLACRADLALIVVVELKAAE